MTVTRITTEAEADAFVEHLRSPGRARPAVLVSTRMGQTTPMLDLDALHRQVSADADVYLIVTGPASYRMSDLLGKEANAFGGASRVYPVGTAWERNVYLSPLRFVWQPADAEKAVRNLVSDARAMADGGMAPVSLPRTFGTNLGELAPLRELQAILSNSPASPASAPEPPAATAAPKPSPGVVAAATGPITITAAPAKSKTALQSTQLALTAAQAEVEALRAQLAKLRSGGNGTVDAAVRDARAESAREIATLRDRAEKQSEQLTALRRKAKSAPEQTETCVGFCPELFPTADEAIRHGIYMAWVARIPATDKDTLALPEYVIGDSFADSLALFDSAQQAKAFRACVDVLTGLARDLAGRRLHALRAGDGGEDPQRTRTADGAVGFRVNIETNSASARRLHFWKLPDGTIELARVVLHDDMSI